MKSALRRQAFITILVAVLAGIGAGNSCTRDMPRSQRSRDGFVHGNGRIEASEVEVATRQPGRVQHIFVRKGDFVVAVHDKTCSLCVRYLPLHTLPAAMR